MNKEGHMNNAPRNGSTPTRVELGLLKEMVSQRFDDLEKLVNEKVERLEAELEGFEDASRERWESDRRAVDKAEASATTAIQVAKAEAEEGIKRHNGLIQMMKDQLSTFATKAEVKSLENTMSRRGGVGEGVRLSAGALAGVTASLAAVVGIIVVLANILTSH